MSESPRGGGGGGSGCTAAAALSRFAIGLGFASLPMLEANPCVRMRVLADAGGAVLFAGVADGGPWDLVRLGMAESLEITEHRRG